MTTEAQLAFGRKMRSCLELMKPSIMILVLLTGATSLILEGSLVDSRQPQGLIRIFFILAALLLTGGSANALNMYLERDLDSQMSRTRNRRPLPLGKIKPREALIFAISIGVAGVAIFAVIFNLLSAALSLVTILFYSIFYTIYLKPRTPYNIVIGGAAGSMAPIIAWAAASGQISALSLLLSAIIFLWTPPHFWALALYLRKDYELVKCPMMPIAYGDRSTKLQILIYVVILVIFSAGCMIGGAGPLYIAVAGLSGLLFVYKAVRMLPTNNNERARGLFRYSIIYLFSIFSALAIDAALKLKT